jgi:hypothetical protein
MKLWFFRTFLFLILLSFTSITHAAELRGRLIGITGASVTVTCDGGDRSAPIGNDGTYAVMGLPAGRTCSFIVSSGNARSAAIPFSTSRSVTIFNGQLRQQNDIILVIRQ